jgi:RHS repeat-associated protein
VVITVLTNSFVPESTFVSIGAVLSTNSSTFDAAGRLLAITNVSGRVTRYEYDKAGRQTGIIDALNNRTDSAYDAAGRLIATTNALGKITRYEYDPIGLQVRTVFPDATFTGTAYNELGQRIRETNLLGLVTDYEYNTNGHLSAIVKPAVLNPEGGTNARPRWEFEYDTANQLSLVRDPKSRVARFSTDFLGRPVSHTLPLGQTASQIYGSAGQLYRKVDFKGQTNEFIYDSFGRIGTNRYYALGSGVATGIVAYVYDDEDRVKQIIEPRGTNILDYDSKGNIARITSPEGIANHEYDMVEGQRLRLYTTNTDLRYSYDELGRLKTVSVIKRDGVTLSTPEVTTNTYTALGSLEDVYFPNGVRAFYEYDLMNRLTNLAYTTSTSLLLAQYRYTPGTNGQWQASTEIVRQANGTYLTNQLTWVYDNLGRLTQEKASANVAGLSFTNVYVYDLVGNRLWKTNVSGSVTEVIGYTYNTNDQLLVENSTVSGSFTNKYDVNGALTNRTSSLETNSYAFNVQNRLASAAITRLDGGVQLAETINYTYDYKGNRVRANWSRSVGGGSSTNGTNLFLIDSKSPLNQVIEELPTIGGTPTASYTLGARTVSQKRGATISHLLPDGHGSTRQLADASGSVTARYTFDAYGKDVDFTNSVQNPTATPLLYSGERLDADAQMYHLQARYYNPTIGRFSQIDPFSPKQMSGAHLYAYCANDPINNSDPTGLYEIDVHQFLTRFLAEAAGLGGNAVTIGDKTQALDAPDDPRDAMHGGVNHRNMWAYHFPSQERMGDLWEEARHSRSYGGSGNPADPWRQVGEYLHALEDTYAHCTGVGDRNWEYYGNVRFYGMTVRENGGLFGHALHGHDNDHTWTDVEKGMNMAQEVYLKMLQFAPSASSPQAWTAIQSKVRDFMSYTPNVYVQRIAIAFVENVTFNGYTEKIHKLDGSYTIDDIYKTRDVYRGVVGKHPSPLRSSIGGGIRFGVNTIGGGYGISVN